MRPYSTLPALLVGGLLLGACAGEDTGAAASAEAAVAPVDALSCYLARGTTMAEAQERPSPLLETPFTVGGHDGLLCYGAPSARGREIMGGLLVYGLPERIGANEPTTIHLSGPATIGDVQVGPGSYSIYAVAGPTEWTIFVNSNWERWGVPIDDAVRATDVGSFTITPEPTGEYVETLRYRFEPMADGTMGDLVLEWENTRAKIHVHPAM